MRKNVSVKVNFIVNFGFMKVNKIEDFIRQANNIHSKIKGEMGRGLNIEYIKKPWRLKLNIEVEGDRDVVKEFLKQLKLHTVGLDVSPKNWYDI